MGGARGRRPLLVLVLAVLLLAPAGAGQGAAARSRNVDSGDSGGAAGPDVAAQTFVSEALGRAMPYVVYLPPGYRRGMARLPVLYMLHGMGGNAEEWKRYGLVDAADRMARAREIQPFIIVMPQGDRSYWMDQAGGAREAWGTYIAHDLVAEVDARYRTTADASQRAIGGVSMGAHGALQLALNHRDRFSIVGGHSLVLRSFDQAPAAFGGRADYASRDPMTLVRSHPDVARSLQLWVDIGDRDPWAARATQFDAELDGLGIAHDWHPWPGDHSAAYWTAHVADYLRFYDRSFRVGAALGAAARAGLVP